MHLTLNTNKLMSLALGLFVAYTVTLLPSEALAGTDSAVIGGMLCRVAGWFTSSVGKGIATLAIIVIGIGALMGKVSWGMAIIVGLGVVIIFGAPTLVREISGTTQGCSPTAGLPVI